MSISLLKKLLFKKFLLSIFLLTYFITNAQTYPVQVTTFMQMPYSSKLSDYANNNGQQRLTVQIFPSDLSILNRRVYLKMYLESYRIKAMSIPVVPSMPIYITGGMTIRLTNLDIANHFKLENIIGLSPQQYAQPLPEGMYTLCFEVYDAVTNLKLSQKSCTSFYLMLNQPPLLNIPVKNETIAASDFPNIMFTWTPRTANATNVSYVFELKEILDKNLDPQIAFMMSPMLYKESLYSTALLYNLSKPNLIPGKTYAWRVRAISTSGFSENAVFKNDGYSDIYHFKYATNCSASLYALSETQSTQKTKISWQSNPKHLKYHIQYRKKDVKKAYWFDVYTQNTSTLLYPLEAGVAYEYRVGATCDNLLPDQQEYTYTPINYFTMPTLNESLPMANCGISPQIKITNKKPITNLTISETFTAGDFPVKILQLQQQGKTYSGTGYVIVPYLGDSKIAVVFNNITINTDYQLIKGFVTTTYEPTGGNIENLQPVIDDIKNLIDGIKETLSEKVKDGTISKEEANTILEEVAQQEQASNKANDQLKQAEQQLAQATQKEDTKAIEEAKNKAEIAQETINNAQQALQNTAQQLGVKAGEGNRISDTYFQGLLPLASNVKDGILQVKPIDGKGALTLKTTDTNFLEIKEVTISKKTYTIVITSSNSTKQELEQARKMVDNPTKGVVIYNHYDLKNNKLGYKVNFADNFFNGINPQDIPEIKALFIEALNNKIDSAENTTDWSAFLLKATSEIAQSFQQAIEKIQLPESIWNPAHQDYNKNTLINIEPLSAGLIDGALDEIKSVPLLISIIVDYSTSATTREKIDQALSDFSFLEAMHSWYEDRKETYQGPIPKIEYQTGKDVVAVGTLLGTGGLATITKIKKGTDFVDGLVTAVKKNTKKVFTNADEFALAIEKVRNVLRDKIKNLPETRELALAFYTKSNINNMNFDKWFENVFKKYEGNTLNFEAHHIIPINILKKSDRLKKLLFDLSQKDPNFKFDFNSIDNGMMLQKKSLKPGKVIDGHANHPKYDEAIGEKIDEIIGNAPNNEEALKNIKKLIEKTKETLKKEVLLGNKDVNDIFKN